MKQIRMIGEVKQAGDSTGCFHREERRAGPTWIDGKKYYWCLDCLQRIKVPKNCQGIYLY